MTSVIHINDNKLIIESEIGSGRFAQSQGYAWLKDGHVVFDLDVENKKDSAVHNCRRNPQQINSHYWQHCDQTSLAKNNAGMRHSADLIWSHLSKLVAQYNLTDVVFVVPSHYQTTNIQLLLGIAQSCGLKVTGVVNKSLLLLHDQVLDQGNYLHIDFQLHQTVCSQLNFANDALALEDVEVLHNVSLQSMQDSFLKTMQSSFIQSTRFDPLHYADTEQQLFDQLPVLAELIQKQGKARPAVEHQSQLHNISIERKQWDDAIHHELTSISNVVEQIGALKVFYSLNGLLISDLSKLNTESNPVVLNDEVSINSPIIKAELNSRQDELVYLTSIELSVHQRNDTASTKPDKLATEAKNVDKQSSKSDIADLHLLAEGIAIPLHKANVSIQGNQLKINSGIGNYSDMISSGALQIMTDPSRSQLQANDRLMSDRADGVITVIEVVE